MRNWLKRKIEELDGLDLIAACVFVPLGFFMILASLLLIGSSIAGSYCFFHPENLACRNKSDSQMRVNLKVE